MTYYTLPKNSNAIEGGRVAEKPHKKLMGKDIQKTTKAMRDGKNMTPFVPKGKEVRVKLSYVGSHRKNGLIKSSGDTNNSSIYLFLSSSFLYLSKTP